MPTTIGRKFKSTQKYTPNLKYIIPNINCIINLDSMARVSSVSK